MKKLFEEPLIYENMLLAYFSDNDICRIFYNDKLNLIIERFLDIFIYEDKQNGTNHVELIKQIYMNSEFENRKEFFKNLKVSKSSFQRYREKYYTALKCIIERISKDEF